MTTEQFQELIELLEHMRKRPALFVGECFNPHKVQSFLDGMRCTLKLIGLDISLYEEIAHSHGWKFMPMGLILEMQERNVSNKKIIDNLIKMEIELYKQSYEKHPF